jgi:scyllo-inositol 2-dehydrogenase (NADP+)
MITAQPHDFQAVPLRVLLVGFGLSARAFHLPFILTNPAYVLTGIVQPSGNSAKTAFPDLLHFQCLEQALAGIVVELVIITAPNELHAPLARQALLAGKHVVVEKPFALSSREARELILLARERQCVLSVYHNRRWDADFLTLQELIRQGRIGKAVQLLSRFDRFRPRIKPGWKEEPGAGRGIFFDLAPHLLDQALLLFGWPAALYAQLRMEREEARTPDAFDLFLYYSNGLTVQLAAGSLVSAPLPRFCMMGTAGSYTKWGMDPQEEALRAGARPASESWGKETRDQWGVLIIEKGGELMRSSYPSASGNYGRYYVLLAAAIQKGAPNPVPPQEALRVIKLLELAEESHLQGRKLLIVSEGEDGLG